MIIQEKGEGTLDMEINLFDGGAKALSVLPLNGSREITRNHAKAIE